MVRQRRSVVFVALVVGLVTAGCGHDAKPAAAAPRTTTTTSTTNVAPTTTATTAAHPVATVPKTTTTRGPMDVPQLRGVQSGQAIVLHAAGYASATATLTTYRRDGSGWTVVAGPWTARVGTKGIAPLGEKREGDLRTPSGTYGFDFAFGVQPNPGVRLSFRRVTGPEIVWDDDPASPLYNQWVDRTQQSPGANPEPMDVQPAYNLGAVIAYNAQRTPGLGSAIFLHVSTGRPTTGCVSLPAAQLRSVLLWLDPTQTPVISITTG